MQQKENGYTTPWKEWKVLLEEPWAFEDWTPDTGNKTVQLFQGPARVDFGFLDAVLIRKLVFDSTHTPTESGVWL